MKIWHFISTVIITALLSGGSVYVWQNNNQKLDDGTVDKAQTTDLFEAVKNSTDPFTYLISKPVIGENFKAIINDSQLFRFAFEYNDRPWYHLSFASDEYGGTDGDPGPHGLPWFRKYEFCATFNCDLQKMEGMGFELTFWDPQYTGGVGDPEFYLHYDKFLTGDILVLETDDYIVTYRPFKDADSEELEKLFQNFTLY